MKGSVVLRSHAGRPFTDQNRRFLKKGNSGMLAKPIKPVPWEAEDFGEQ